ncbi:RimK-like protein [Bradyrhizobium sp.]|uniref:ATP-grasp domain-containing protein n=1 Tax=Bradyrhizobium sp. TaxID=376 RepID=UPI00239A12E8|nr:RimK-like protein [Bradyrhizobium sp.]MDE2379814.1 RimK-like protein [Bradyrhizobium sp.]
MPSDERIFVKAIRKYCAQHGIAVDVRAGGWLIAMRRGAHRHFALGYDIGINSAIAHRLASDKCATAEVLALSGVPCIPHHLFLNPNLGAHIAAPGWRETMLGLLARHPQGLVVKPNEGTAGRSVFKVTNPRELERAVADVFASSSALAISPFVDIEQEVRVTLLDRMPMVVYRKERTSGWRHNLDAGARPVLIEQGEIRDACATMAIDAARAIGIDFASIDLVHADGGWKVLEINSGVMMEVLGKFCPDLVDAIYAAALDRIFDETAR